MHSVALTVDGEVWTTGVNDEGALGRETGLRLCASFCCQAASDAGACCLRTATMMQHDNCWQMRGALSVNVCPLCAAGELWEKSGFAKGRPGDSYTWGRADVSCGHGKIVQVSAGALITTLPMCLSLELAYWELTLNIVAEAGIAVLLHALCAHALSLTAPVCTQLPLLAEPLHRLWVRTDGSWCAVEHRAGDSHTVALTEAGFVWAWGTFRDASGVFGFSPSERIALLPRLVHRPEELSERAVKIASGAALPLASQRPSAIHAIIRFLALRGAP